MKRRNMIPEWLCSLLVAAFTSCQSPTVRIDSSVPTTKVQKGDIQVKVVATGQLKSVESRILTAPPVGGGTLQIVKLARTGTPIHVGDIVMQFDPSEQEYNLEQNRNDLAQAEQEIVKARADSAVQTSQDQLALLKDKFAVRRAELEVSKNELVSEIDAKRNLMTFEEAKRALAQLQEDIKSHTAANNASVALSEEKKHKAQLAIEQAEQNIQKMTVKSPIEGLIMVHVNRDATGGAFFDGMQLPEYRVGDQTRPGSAVAEVIDIGKLEVTVQAKETDRSQLTAEQNAEVTVNALPAQQFNAVVQAVAGSSAHEFWDDNSQRTFEVTLKLLQPDSRLRPGYAANVTVLGDRMPSVLYVHREAVFEDGDKSIVYLRSGGSFERKVVKVLAYSEGNAVIEGVPLGAEVALVNPEKQGKQKKDKSSEGPALSAGTS